jgi:ABC-type multidrug transport system ATPase subunit
MTAALAERGGPLIEADGLRVKFGKVTALDGLDLVAERGQVLAVLGPNGAGKTTFVRTAATSVKELHKSYVVATVSAWLPSSLSESCGTTTRTSSTGLRPGKVLSLPVTESR